MRSKLKQARNRIEALRLALLSPSPEEIGAALPGLEEAARCLEIVEQEVREGAFTSHEVRRELRLLKNELRISGKLIAQGMAFCRAWANLLGAGPAYTQEGQPVPAEPLVNTGGRLSVRG